MPDKATDAREAELDHVSNNMWRIIIVFLFL